MDHCVNDNTLDGFSSEGIGDYQPTRRRDGAGLLIASVIAIIVVCGAVRCSEDLVVASKQHVKSALDPHEGGRGGIVSPRPQFIFDREAASAPARTLNTSAPGAVGCSLDLHTCAGSVCPGAGSAPAPGTTTH